MTGTKHVELYRQRDRLWRYRVWSANGRNVDNPGQGYRWRSSARRAAKREHPGLPITTNRRKVW